MKILLLGEYSNVHSTLAKGFRELGHDCVVASDGDKWKNYPRDIDLNRGFGFKNNVSFAYRLAKALPHFCTYDVVQLINPIFIELKAEKIPPFYEFLKAFNKKIVLGAFGLDYYWAKVNSSKKPLEYSDFNFGSKLRTDPVANLIRNDWYAPAKKKLTQKIASDCNGIVAGLYEYWVTYNSVPSLRDKLTYIPFPIEQQKQANLSVGEKINIFIGISKNRSEYKGTDIMLQAAKDLKSKYPTKINLQIAEGIEFSKYQQLLDSADIVIDQLYSYTPAMNALLAMSKGKIVIGGGENSYYDFIGEKELRPIINVKPNYESCYYELEQLILHTERIEDLKAQNIKFIAKHHDYINVAQQYINFFERL